MEIREKPLLLSSTFFYFYSSFKNLEFFVVGNRNSNFFLNLHTF